MHLMKEIKKKFTKKKLLENRKKRKYNIYIIANQKGLLIMKQKTKEKIGYIQQSIKKYIIRKKLILKEIQTIKLNLKLSKFL